MCAIPFQRQAKTASDAPGRHGYWHRLALAIDWLAAYPVKHALSEDELRRVDGEIVRCRKLMLPRPQQLGAAITYSLPARRTFAPVKVRR